MKRIAAALLVALCGCAGAQSVPTPAARSIVPQQTHAIPIATSAPVSDPCDTGGSVPRCAAQERDDVRPQDDTPSLPPDAIAGYHPSDLQAAYGLSNGTSSATIGIVVPYGYAAAASDLAVYRAKFGLAPCTLASNCLRIIDETAHAGARVKAAWSIEAAIDLQMASAACPSCALLLVEARSDEMIDLAHAVDTAVSARPQAIAISWTIPEDAFGSSMPPPLAHDGVAVVAGTGDSGAGVGWPADDPSVLAVGGTTLVADSGVARGFRETGWAMAGYGCSAFFAKPDWQTGSCASRAVADLGAVADPATGVSIYDSQPTGHGHWGSTSGWAVYGGTSVAAPIVAAAIARAGNGAQLSTPQYLYAHAAQLNSVAAGESPLQSGLGSPNGSGGL